ncbi:alpha/beta hydrolase [Serratia inhibens]|uniref:Alpha/beta hydrolase n=1 Tax=Serratia inhibens TaxID=2338073 RepID=A0AA92X8D5_9GAMM|nr:alpha/beta hydrolase [Serratia inhibens]ANS42975.1 Carboxylesterase A [Serratia inhibens PRI-2C]RJF57577.1 alpha/beta hydrolase [Serratia inhibens]
MRFPTIVFIAVIFCTPAAFARGLPSQIQPISWVSCKSSSFNQWFDGAKIPARLQCGYVEAPLSYGSDNTHEKVRLAVTRLPATGKKQGSVLSIPGGPGLPGIQVPIETEELNEGFDIIGYDPRGVGQSRPKISCSTQPDDNTDDVAGNTANTADAEKVSKTWLEGCINRTTLHVLKHLGTDEAVNDVDVIRAALGEDKLNAIAFSYGTQVAALYAERFPKNIGALVFDGVMDISDDAFSSDYKQALSFQHSFERFAAYCEEEQQCQLTKAHATANYHSLLEKVDNLALTDENGEEIGAGNIISATTKTLYSSEDWPELAKLLRSIDSDKFDYQALAILDKTDEQATEAEQNIRPRAVNIPKPQYLTDSNADVNAASAAEEEAANLTLIGCIDSANPGGNLKQSRLKEQKLVDASPFSNYPVKAQSPRNVCDLWPFKGTMPAHIPVVSAELPPLLFVAQLYDPATPYEGAKRMATFFNSPLITVNGDGHTIALSNVNQCVDDEVIDYFISPKKVRANKNC